MISQHLRPGGSKLLRVLLCLALPMTVDLVNPGAGDSDSLQATPDVKSTCEVVVNPDSRNFLEVINDNGDISIDFRFVIPLNADIDAGVCERFGLPTGSHTITVIRASDGASRNYSFSLRAGETHVLRVTGSFFGGTPAGCPPKCDLCQVCDPALGHCVNERVCMRCDRTGAGAAGDSVCDGTGACFPFEDICKGYSLKRTLIADRGICDIDTDGRADRGFDCGVTAIFKLEIKNMCGSLPPTARISERVVVNGCGYKNVVLRDRERGSCNPPCEDAFSACFTNWPLDFNPPIPKKACPLTFTQTLFAGKCSVTRKLVFKVSGNGRTCTGRVASK